MVIKHASRKDIAALTAVETACFPPAEAATEKEFIDRVQYYGNHFWLLYEGDKLLAFVDGFVTDEPDLTVSRTKRRTSLISRGARAFRRQSRISSKQRTVFRNSRKNGRRSRFKNRRRRQLHEKASVRVSRRWNSRRRQ